MERTKERLKLDPMQTCQQIEEFLRQKLTDIHKEGILIGLSGGLDSAIAAYLATRAIGATRVILLNLPDKDSKDIHRQHAHIVAGELGVPLTTSEITAPLNSVGVYELLPLRLLPARGLQEIAIRLSNPIRGAGGKGDYLAERFNAKPNSLVANGNAYASIKHRLRMVLLYYEAERKNLMIVGAANKTEYLTGTFSKWGCDQCADVMPLLHLYRSQLKPLAEYLGIPEEIRTKAADPDVIPGVDNKEALLGSFLTTDLILWGMENNLDQQDLSREFGDNNVKRIVNLVEASRHMRESPYSLL